jgi:hypothetical protein
MDFFTALALLQEQVHIFSVLAIALAVALAYYLAFHGRLHHLFDPLSWVLVFSSVTLTLLLILYLEDFISSSKVAWTLGVLVAFYGSFLLLETYERSSPRAQIVTNTVQMRPPERSALLMLLVVNSALWVVTYVFFGIPLFLESRLEQFAQGGGVGLLSRLTSGLDFVCLVMGMLSLRLGQGARLLGLLLVAQYIITAMLSGSKAALVSLLFAYYLVEACAQGRWDTRLKTSGGKLMLAGLVILSPIAVLIAKGVDGDTNAIVQLFTRVAAEGDAYILFYGGDLIDELARFDPIALLRPLLATFRLASPESMVNPGFEVVASVLGVDNPTAGPNSRLPIYLYFFYGWSGLALAPLLGIGLYASRRAVRRSFQSSPLHFSVQCSIYLLFTKVEVDPQLTVNGLVNLLIVFPILSLAALCHSRSGRCRVHAPGRRAAK